MSSLCTIATALCGTLAGLTGSIGITPVPTVDLSYNLQQPTLLNAQYDVQVFYDIRYAAPPTGENRFRAPHPPVTDRSQVQKGGERRICAQGTPAWQAVTNQFVTQYTAGKTTFKPSDFPSPPPPSTTPDARTYEDCLFLDVYVPRTVLENAGKTAGVPVIVQIYGGGYIAGAKDLDPTGFFVRDKEQGGAGIVFVSINYRLGAFGWLAGSSFQKNGDANAGLLDQHFALQWVQKYISRFGWNPNNVTVIGESAGAGSIMYQITAYGGTQNTLPFQKAIIQSPGFQPQENDFQREQTFVKFLRLLNVTSLADARKLPFSNVFAANSQQIYESPYGQFTFGSAVDGTCVPDLPGKLLLDGKFNKNVAVMAGHNANEGIGFTSPFVQDAAGFKQDVGSWMPPRVATASNLDYISNTLYSSENYQDQIARTDAALSELIFTCNTFYLDKAFNNQTYTYVFAVPPAYHGNDVAFTYYTGPSLTTDAQAQVAISMQKHFLHFAKTGNPNGADISTWDQYGSEAMLKVFNTTGNLRMAKDDTANGRCNFWQTTL